MTGGHAKMIIQLSVGHFSNPYMCLTSVACKLGQNLPTFLFAQKKTCSTVGWLGRINSIMCRDALTIVCGKLKNTTAR